MTHYVTSGSNQAVLIATGSTTKSEILNLTGNMGKTCKHWADYPFEVDGAIGANIGDNLLVCGGRKKSDEMHRSSDECYVVNDPTDMFLIKMTEKRAYAGGLVLGKIKKLKYYIGIL